MNLYRYTSADGRARILLDNRNGERLPGDPRAWLYLGPQQYDDPRLGTPPVTIVATIQRNGYFPLHQARAAGADDLDRKVTG